MEEPICLNQNFVNKQNLRSYANILKMRVLKNEDSVFLHLVFEDKEEVSGLPIDVRKVLSAIKTSLHSHCKDDFKKFFLDVKIGGSLAPLNKVDIFSSCLNALLQIIPQYFFGGHNNLKVFENIVRTVIYSMKLQHMLFSPLIKKWDFSRHIWKTMEPAYGKKVLRHILLWIIKYVVSPMISLNFYVTTCKLDADDNKLHFFWKSQWQSFYDTKISDLIFSRILKRFEPYCFGKKSKRKYVHSEWVNFGSMKKYIPKLHLVLKPNNDYRPIVRYKSKQPSQAQRYQLKEKLNFFKTLTGTPQPKIEIRYMTIYQQWLKSGKPKLYFIKTDLSNAFGAINREKLMKMLCDKHMAYQATEKCSMMKKKTAQHYKEMMIELRKPILVRAGNTVYEWREGLVQGYKYSPALSELYYTCLDETYFSEHLKNPDSRIKFLTRVVDDYLYITDSLEDANSFLDSLSRHKNVNYGKTIVNFEHPHIQSSDEIIFLGNSYNTKTLQVSRASNIYVGQMCYKIAFTNALANKLKFLENRIGQSGIQINGHIFNLNHNTEELIWIHIFTTYLLSANKFCTILAVLCEQREMIPYVLLYKKRVAVKLTNSMIDTLMRHKPSDCMFLYCINHFRFLAFKALYLIAKQTPTCRSIMSLINDEMTKANCLYGKWKDHAARVDPSGASTRPAIKEVCRRLDLRVIIKKFDSLPTGIQCYNNKLL